MSQIDICTFSKSAKLNPNTDIHIVFFDRMDYTDVMETYKDLVPQYEHWYNIRIADTFYEAIVFSKSEEIYYNPMLSLRTVLTPFVQNGQPRGWFYDESMKPVRFTGIGNSLYFKSPIDNGEISWECYRLFMDMYSQENDAVNTNLKHTKPVDEKALKAYEYRFCPLKDQKKREEYFANLKTDKTFRFGATIN